MMRWETHVHTAEGSACGKAPAAEMAAACRKAGYDGMIVTDHFWHGNTAVNRDLPWQEWVRQFCLGYEHGKAAGKKIGLRVCFGWEYSWDGTDFLTYGLSPEWLLAHPETVTLPPQEYLRLIRRSGGCIVHAHPFREASYVPLIKLLPDQVDAVETYNKGNFEEIYNDRARWYAESYGLLQTSGSDAHHAGAFGGGILTDADIHTTEDYAAAVLHGQIAGLIRNGADMLSGNDYHRG
ncbi:MAG: PHP domain-containing protein [Oscillospiraceae bacterium]|nr:PHP domain-containing protein [Oscillospiraceae bacterium]